MSDTRPSLTKRLQWRCEVLTHSLIECIASVLPGSWVYQFGGFLGLVAWRLMPRRRKVVLRNLRIAFAGEKELVEIEKMARESFFRAGANLISVAHTSSLKPSELSDVIEMENPELIQQSMDRGKGVVLLLAHMGNWELLSRLTHLFPEEVKTGAMYRPLNNPYLDERVRRRRQADGTCMFSKRDPFHQITGFLRDGGVVGVLADQRVGVSGDDVRFFGRLTKASPLPSLLARRSKSDVLALSLSTVQPGKWKAKLLPVESPPSTEHCMAALEAAMKQSPEDVFWLQERWKVRLDSQYDMGVLYGGRTSDEGKNHRALLWLVGADEFSELPSNWLHPDLRFEVVVEPGGQVPANLPEDVPVHRIVADTSWCTELASVDELAVLPIDLVVGVKASRRLAKVCRQERIPFYLLDQIGVSPLKSAKYKARAQ